MKVELIDDINIQPITITFDVSKSTITFSENFRKRYLTCKSKRVAFLLTTTGFGVYIKTSETVLPRGCAYVLPSDHKIVSSKLIKLILSHISAPFATYERYIYGFTLTASLNNTFFTYQSETKVKDIPHQILSEYSGAWDSYAHSIPDLLEKAGNQVLNLCKDKLGYCTGYILAYIEGENTPDIFKKRSPWSSSARRLSDSCYFHSPNLIGFFIDVTRGNISASQWVDAYELLSEEQFFPRYPIRLSTELRDLIRSLNNSTFNVLGKLCDLSINVSTRVPVMLGFDYKISDNEIFISYLEFSRYKQFRNDPDTFGMLHPTTWFTAPRRTQLKLGKFLKRLFPEIPDIAIEQDVNKLKSITCGNYNFEEVRGSRILEAYSEENYLLRTGVLGSSCMRYNSCQERLLFYAKNSNISCLIMTVENKILARALLFKTKNHGIVMDRIYYSQDHQVYQFIDYARKNNITSVFNYRVPKHAKALQPYHQGIDYWTDDFKESLIVELDWVPEEADYGNQWIKHKQHINHYLPYLDNFFYLNPVRKLLSTQAPPIVPDPEAVIDDPERLQNITTWVGPAILSDGITYRTLEPIHLIPEQEITEQEITDTDVTFEEEEQ